MLDQRYMRFSWRGDLVAVASRSQFVVGVLAVCLSGCVEQAADLPLGGLAASDATPASVVAARADVSPRGAPIALASLEGAPQAVSARFAEAFVAAAGTRNMALVDVAKARYLVRGYLTAYAVEGGLALGYVWDVFEPGRSRAKRLSDAIVVKAGAGSADPWAAADEATIAKLAAQGVDNLAAFLSTTPEAIAAAKSGRPALAGRPAAQKPLAYVGSGAFLR
jgi:hypothetical protein